MSNIYLKQMFANGEPDRDPGGRGKHSVAYYALIKIDDLDYKLREDNGAH
ncbi:MAG: hypothetical protein R2744_11905 [Bacteroidales bacterium]